MAHVRKLKNRRSLPWQARWIDPAGRERSRSFRTRDEADQHVIRITAAIQRGEYQLPTELNVLSWSEQWVARQESWRPATVRQQQSRLTAHIIPALGSLPIEAVRRSDLDALAERLSRAGLSVSTRRAVLVLACQMLRAAVSAGHLVADPAAGFELPSSPDEDESVDPYSVLTVAEVAALRDAMPSAEHALMVALIAGTGMRITEARSLTIDRLKLDSARPSVRVDRQLVGAATSPGQPLQWGPPKGGKHGKRTIQITPTLAAALSAHVGERSERGFVFESPQYAGRPTNPRSLGEVWGAAMRRAGIEAGARRGWHSLRHHHASLLIAQGISAVAVQRRLGHSSPTVTLGVYSHLWEGDEAAIIRALDTP